MGRRISVLIVGFFLLIAQSFAANPSWVQVKSPNFTVITDASEKRGREVALHFEQMRAVFGTLFAKIKVTSSQPLYILAFRNTKEFRSVCPLWNGKAEELAGYFQPGNGVTYIALDLGAENKWQAIFHEYGHFLLNSNSIETPPWFDEGFAEYYSTVKVDGKNFVFGNIPLGDPEILQQYKWLPVDQLFTVTRDSASYNERNRQTIFYAEAWLAMAHYWFNSTKQKQVGSLLELQEKGVPVEEAIQKSFGMDAKALDKDLHNFYSSGRLGLYKGAMPPGLDNVGMTATPVDDIDARARVAELKLQMRDHRAESVQEFEAIVKEQPSHPVALRGLAYAALQSGDKQKASDYFRRASTLQSDDPHIYYFSAVLLTQLDAQHDPEMLSDMQKNLERAVQLDPSFADAYGWLALAHNWQGKPEEAIASAEKAVELSPRSEQWAMNLAGFYANAKRYDDALKMCQRLTHSTDQAIAQQASSMFESLTKYKAQMSEYEDWQKKQAQRAENIEERPDSQNADSQNANSQNDGTQSTPVLRQRGSNPGHIRESSVLNYFVGTLVKVSCAGKRAKFEIASPTKPLTLTAPDIEQVSFSGKQSFSCGVQNVKVKGFYSKKLDTNQVVALEFEESAAGK